MKHYDRVYLHGHATVDAVALFVDTGSVGYNHAVLDPTGMSPAVLAYFFASGSCFFKLPAEGYAVVDIYASDKDKSQPKLFDYQVFRSKQHVSPKKEHEAAKQEAMDYLQSLESGSAGESSKPDSTSSAIFATGFGARCLADEPCNGVVEIDCPNPVTHIPVCDNGELKCQQAGGG